MHSGPLPQSGKFSVIGVTPAVIGAIQATEAIKLMLGTGVLLLNRLIVFDGLTLRWTEFKLKINPECDHCAHLQQKEERSASESA
jgi:adenylyltransferase/sulfurtransferase